MDSTRLHEMATQLLQGTISEIEFLLLLQYGFDELSEFYNTLEPDGPVEATVDNYEAYVMRKVFA